MTDEFWADRWHWCALAAGFIAAQEGSLADSQHVREIAYRLYEGGAFRDCGQQPLSLDREAT